MLHLFCNQNISSSQPLAWELSLKKFVEISEKQGAVEEGIEGRGAGYFLQIQIFICQPG